MFWSQFLHFFEFHLFIRAVPPIRTAPNFFWVYVEQSFTHPTSLNLGLGPSTPLRIFQIQFLHFFEFHPFIRAVPPIRIAPKFCWGYVERSFIKKSFIKQFLRCIDISDLDLGPSAPIKIFLPKISRFFTIFHWGRYVGGVFRRYTNTIFWYYSNSIRIYFSRWNKLFLKKKKFEDYPQGKFRTHAITIE